MIYSNLINHTSEVEHQAKRDRLFKPCLLETHIPANIESDMRVSHKSHCLSFEFASPSQAHYKVMKSHHSLTLDVC